MYSRAQTFFRPFAILYVCFNGTPQYYRFDVSVFGSSVFAVHTKTIDLQG